MFFFISSGSKQFMKDTGLTYMVYIDPVGAILIAIYIAVTWYKTGNGMHFEDCVLLHVWNIWFFLKYELWNKYVIRHIALLSTIQGNMYIHVIFTNSRSLFVSGVWMVSEIKLERVKKVKEFSAWRLDLKPYYTLVLGEVAPSLIWAPMFVDKADLKSNIPLETADIFSVPNHFLKQDISSEYVMVDFIFMGLFGLQGAKPRIIKWKILAHSGTRSNDPWITRLLPRPLGHQIWHTNDNLKLN